MFHTILIVGGLVSFLLGAFGVPAKVNWELLGFACLTATLLF